MNAPAALEMFRCDRQGATLTKAGCARMFLKAAEERPKPWESIAHCIACDLGAQHAGRPVEAVGFAEASEAIRTICPRCLRRTDRMVRPSCVGGRAMCISCTNRTMECFRWRASGEMGKNGKGGRPMLLDQLHTEHLIVADAAGERQVTVENVVSAAEAIFALAREAKGPTAFSRASRRIGVIPTEEVAA